MILKKAAPLFMAAAMLGGVFAAGCNKEHTHDYKWEHDETNHWQVCKDNAEHTTEKQPHDWENEQDEKCDTCGYDRGTQMQQSTTGPLPAGKKIYVVGDSTVCSFTDNYYLPRYGYGTQLAEYLNVKSEQVVNLALSGRSSKSFTYGLDVDSGNKNAASGELSCYEYLTTNISTGDYLIIGFGHNDEKKEPARFTDPAGTTATETTAKGTSFKWNLNEKYIKVAKNKGATPILCTPITRYDDKTDENAYTGAKVHDTADGDYSQAIRDLGTETGTTVVDLTALTVAEYKKDNAAAALYHAHTTYKGEIIPAGAGGKVPYTGEETPNGLDGTHLNKFGAKMVAYQFAKAIEASDCSLKNHVKKNITAPTKADSYLDAIKKDFVKLPYDGFTAEKKSEHWTTITKEGWYGTVLGSTGGQSKIWDTTKEQEGETDPLKLTQFTVKQEGDKFIVGNQPLNGKAACGKTASNKDGMAAVFMQIPKADNFKATVTVKVTSEASDANNQSAFGMMLRDDIYIDTYDDTLSSNYVAAGFIKTKGAIFARESIELKNPADVGQIDYTIDYAVNTEYTLEIERSGQVVTVKVGDLSKTYTDFDFFAVDNDYMYLCLFANRGLLCEFSNLNVVVETGASQGA